MMRNAWYHQASEEELEHAARRGDARAQAALDALNAMVIEPFDEPVQGPLLDEPPIPRKRGLRLSPADDEADGAYWLERERLYEHDDDRGYHG